MVGKSITLLDELNNKVDYYVLCRRLKANYKNCHTLVCYVNINKLEDITQKLMTLSLQIKAGADVSKCRATWGIHSKRALSEACYVLMILMLCTSTSILRYLYDASNENPYLYESLSFIIYSYSLLCLMLSLNNAFCTSHIATVIFLLQLHIKHLKIKKNITKSYENTQYTSAVASNRN